MIEDFDNIPGLPAIMGPAHQVAYVVDDIDTAMRRWHSEHGVGPFLVTRNAVPLSNAYYRGRKAQTNRAHIAFAYVGDMQLELIELVGDTPGLYREARDRRLTGVHHYAVLVEDFLPERIGVTLEVCWYAQHKLRRVMISGHSRCR